MLGVLTPCLANSYARGFFIAMLMYTGMGVVSLFYSVINAGTIGIVGCIKEHKCSKMEL